MHAWKSFEKKGHHFFRLERIKIFDTLKSLKSTDKYVLIIPYTTFWALLGSYKTKITENMTKRLHEVDYERMITDDKQQTLIEQIKGEKALSQILFEEIDKCETLHHFTHACMEKFFRKSC